MFGKISSAWTRTPQNTRLQSTSESNRPEYYNLCIYRVLGDLKHLDPFASPLNKHLFALDEVVFINLFYYSQDGASPAYLIYFFRLWEIELRPDRTGWDDSIKRF